MIGISEELKNTDPDLLSPLTLAFVGDTVFDLLVRGNLVMQANRPVGKLHPLAATKVCAAAQARDARDIAPHLAEITDKVLFGDVWENPALKPRDRSLVTITCLIAMYRINEMPFHIKKALENGVTKEEIIEAVTQIAFYAGWPPAMWCAPWTKRCGAMESRDTCAATTAASSSLACSSAG